MLVRSSRLVLAATAVLLAASCSPKATNALKTSCPTPWLAGRIAEVQRNSRGLDSVVEYQFQGSPVYAFFLATVADGETPIYRCDGTQLCQLGGFAGNRMCDGVLFSEGATAPRTVWRK